MESNKYLPVLVMGRTAALTVAKDSNAIDNADTNMVKLFS